MINFNKNSVWNLKPIRNESVIGDINGLLTSNEAVIAAFKTVRDQLVFTNKRIISIDVQGITGKRKSFSSLPYSRIQFFAVQTPGFLELISDSELYLIFTSGFEAKFEFDGSVNIGQIARVISEYVLIK